MTRTTAHTARSARTSAFRTCALLGTFGAGTAALAAIFVAPAGHHPATGPRLALASPQPLVRLTTKQARVHSPAAALPTPPLSPRPAPAAAAAKSGRPAAILASIPRPARSTVPLPLSRMALADAGAAGAFVPPIPMPKAEPARLASLGADAPIVLASLPTADVAGGEAVEDHVERQLPEPKPQSAAAALTQAIDDAAIPLPAARPERVLPAPRSRRSLPTANVLAYARPDAGADPSPEIEEAAPMQGLSRGVAVYDISAATVYLPNGEKLEAHSGLGKMRDDPRQVHQKNRGPTPPHTYDLTMRESLFHGVEAIRLHPVGGQKNIHNRDGLLAHTYMLGKGGDSNGCVSFKDYKRFLAAFKRGDVKRLVVVSSMRSSRLARPKSLIASLFGSKT